MSECCLQTGLVIDCIVTYETNSIKVLLVMVYLVFHQGTAKFLLLQTLLEMKTPFIGKVTLKVSRPAELTNRPFVQLNDCFGLKKVVKLKNSLIFLNFSLYLMSC